MVKQKPSRHRTATKHPAQKIELSETLLIVTRTNDRTREAIETPIQ
jgi:hypothetical protein